MIETIATNFKIFWSLQVRTCVYAYRTLRSCLCVLEKMTTLRACDEELRERDWEKKIYADTSRGAQPCDLQMGDQVLLKQEKSNKLSTNFQPEPYEIVERKGNSVVIQSLQKSQKGQYHRNVIEVKTFNTREEQPDHSSDH